MWQADSGGTEGAELVRNLPAWRSRTADLPVGYRDFEELVALEAGLAGLVEKNRAERGPLLGLERRYETWSSHLRPARC